MTSLIAIGNVERRIDGISVAASEDDAGGIPDIGVDHGVDTGGHVGKPEMDLGLACALLAIGNLGRLVGTRRDLLCDRERASSLAQRKVGRVSKALPGIGLRAIQTPPRCCNKCRQRQKDRTPKHSTQPDAEWRLAQLRRIRGGFERARTAKVPAKKGCQQRRESIGAKLGRLLRSGDGRGNLRQPDADGTHRRGNDAG